MSREADLQAAIAVALSEQLGALVLRANAGGGQGPSGNWVKGMPAGTSDLLCCVPPSGRFVGVEVKTPTGRQSPQQGAFERSVHRRGGVYVLARSVDEAITRVRQAVGLADAQG